MKERTLHNKPRFRVIQDSRHPLLQAAEKARQDAGLMAETLKAIKVARILAKAPETRAQLRSLTLRWEALQQAVHEIAQVLAELNQLEGVHVHA
jgi:hypothetical protein